MLPIPRFNQHFLSYNYETSAMLDYSVKWENGKGKNSSNSLY